MSVVIAYEEAGPWRKRLTIEVPAPAVEAETGRILKSLSRQVQLPGFRKGKVPGSLILKRFQGEVEQKVSEKLVPRYWHQAEAEKNLDALTPPQVEELNFTPGKPMTFVAVVETRPEIELKNVDDFTLPDAAVKLDDDEVEQMIRDMRRRHAEWIEVERPAATGDLVEGQVIDVAAAPEDDEEPAEGVSQPLRIEIGGEGTDEELSLALTGLSAGASTSFRRSAGPPGGDRGELGAGEGGEREYRIEVSSVQEQELPELDEDFAQKMGAPSVEALRENVVQHLRGLKKSEAQQKRETALLEQLRERHPMELPQGVVDREAERMMQEQASRFAAQGIDLETAPINWEAMAAQIRPEAQKRVHSSLVLDAVAKHKEIKLDEAEFERVLADIARQQKKTSLAVRQELDASGRLSMLRSQLLERQTVRHLLGEDAEDSDGAGEDAGEES